MKCHDFSRVSRAASVLPSRYGAAVTDSTRPDPRRQGAEQLAARPGRPGKRAGYLPAAQVIEELSRLDLTTIADELRIRLTESDRPHHDP
jgi:hypothetical protein